jgi:hypothetical protein
MHGWVDLYIHASLNPVLDGERGKIHVPAALTPRKQLLVSIGGS